MVLVSVHSYNREAFQASMLLYIQQLFCSLVDLSSTKGGKGRCLKNCDDGLFGILLPALVSRVNEGEHKYLFTFGRRIPTGMLQYVPAACRQVHEQENFDRIKLRVMANYEVTFPKRIFRFLLRECFPSLSCIFTCARTHTIFSANSKTTQWFSHQHPPSVQGANLHPYFFFFF